MNGELDKAIEILAEAYLGQKAALGPSHQTTISTGYLLGISLVEAERGEEALLYLEAAVDYRLDRWGWRNPYSVRAMTALGQALDASGDVAAARQIAHAILEEQPPVDNQELEIPFTLITYAKILRSHGDIAASLCLLMDNIQTDDAISRFDRFYSFLELGITLALVGDINSEADAYCRAWTLYEDEPNSARCVEARARYGHAIARLGNIREAKEHLQAARASSRFLPAVKRDLPDKLLAAVEQLEPPE